MNHRNGLRFLLALLALILVSCARPPAPELDVTPPVGTLVAGQGVQLTVTRRFLGGAVEDVTSTVTYATSDGAVATVSPHGVVTAGSQPGPAIVTALDASSEATATITVTVVPQRITSIDLSPAPVSVQAPGTTRVFAAAGHFNDGSTRDVTHEVVWSSTNPFAAVAGDTQSDKGNVKALAEGSATIVATDPITLIDGRSLVTVSRGAPQLVAITVTPSPGTVQVGKSAPFVALGVLSDGSTQDVTRVVTWSSSRTDVATVDTLGIVTGVLAGDTTITAVAPEPTPSVRGSAPAKVVP